MPSLKTIAVTAAFSVARIVAGVVVASAILATIQSVAHAAPQEVKPYTNLGAYRIMCLSDRPFSDLESAIIISLRCRATEAAFKLPAPTFSASHPAR